MSERTRGLLASNEAIIRHTEKMAGELDALRGGAQRTRSAGHEAATAVARAKAGQAAAEAELRGLRTALAAVECGGDDRDDRDKRNASRSEREEGVPPLRGGGGAREHAWGKGEGGARHRSGGGSGCDDDDSGGGDDCNDGSGRSGSVRGGSGRGGDGDRRRPRGDRLKVVELSARVTCLEEKLRSATEKIERHKQIAKDHRWGWGLGCRVWSRIYKFGV